MASTTVISGERDAPVAEQPCYLVDLVELIPLVKQPHQAPDHRGLCVPQLDRLHVTGESLLGPILKLGDLGVQESVRPTSLAPTGNLRRQGSRGFHGRAVPSAGLVDQVQGVCQAPGRPLLPLALADVLHELTGLGRVVGCEGEVKATHQDPEIIRLDR